MDIKLIRKADGEIIVKKDVKEVTKNFYGNIRIIFNNEKSLTLQKDLWEVKTE
jgi:hypothetical protein